MAHPDYQVVLDSNGEASAWKGSWMEKVELLQGLMDGRRKTMEDIVVQTGQTKTNPKWVLNKGRYEAFGVAIATFRGTSLAEEIVQSNERLGIS